MVYCIVICFKCLRKFRCEVEISDNLAVRYRFSFSE